MLEILLKPEVSAFIQMQHPAFLNISGIYVGLRVAPLKASQVILGGERKAQWMNQVWSSVGKLLPCTLLEEMGRDGERALGEITPPHPTPPQRWQTHTAQLHSHTATALQAGEESLHPLV